MTHVGSNVWGHKLSKDQDGVEGGTALQEPEPGGRLHMGTGLVREESDSVKAAETTHSLPDFVTLPFYAHL